MGVRVFGGIVVALLFGSGAAVGVYAPPAAAADTPAISVLDTYWPEGSTGGLTPITVTLSISPTPSVAIHVDYTTVDGTASSGSDYTTSSGNITIAAGKRTRDIDLTVNADASVEPNETFSVVLSNPSDATLGDRRGDIIIVNDDRPAPDCSDGIQYTDDAVDAALGYCTHTLQATADGDGDGFTPSHVGGADCNDADPGIHPGAVDLPGDGIDQDCSGSDLAGTADCDDGSAVTSDAYDPVLGYCTHALDASTDGDGDGAVAAQAGGTDCNDGDANVFPGAIEVSGNGVDDDCDGLVDALAPDCNDGNAYTNDIFDLAARTCTHPLIVGADLDGDRYKAAPVGGNDCNDADAQVRPKGTEVLGNGIDDNCDGLVDDGAVRNCDEPNPYTSDRYKPNGNFCAHTVRTVADLDHDGSVAAQVGGTDCNDADAAVHPGATEVAGNGLDDNCDGVTDQPPPTCDDGSAYTTDGQYTPGATCAHTLRQDVDDDGDGFQAAQIGGTDCDDADPGVHPDAPEATNGIDDDCDGVVDGLGPVCDDGFAYTADSYDTAAAGCVAALVDGADFDGDGAVASDVGGADCNDANAAIHPGATEILANGLDDDCDGITDATRNCDDGNGYTTDEFDVVSGACAHVLRSSADDDGDRWKAAPVGGSDCNDANPAIKPGVAEIEGNGVDDNCDGVTDDGPRDCTDGNAYTADGYLVAGNRCTHTVLTGSDLDADGTVASQVGGTDCNDADPAVGPGAAESVGNGVDDNCDGLVDQIVDCADASAYTSDSYDAPAGTCLHTIVATADLDGDGSVASEVGGADCNDANADVHPGAEEISGNGIDDDCNGFVDVAGCADDSVATVDGFDEALGYCTHTVVPVDADGDGFTAPVSGGTDCDDASSDVHPGKEQTVANGVDDDCTGVADDGISPLGVVTQFAATPPTCPIGDVCTGYTVECQDTPLARAFVAVGTPPGPARGVITLYSGARGENFWGIENETAVTDLKAAGFVVVRVAWPDTWTNTLPDGPYGLDTAACRAATTTQWAYETQYLPLNLPHTPEVCGFCIGGNSGGAVQSAYSLSDYGQDSIIDAMVISSGPTMAALAEACLGGSENSQYALADVSRGLVDLAYGFPRDVSGACFNHDSAYEAQWREDGLTEGATDYSYETTRVYLLLGGLDTTTAPAHAQAYLASITAGGSPFVTTETFPNAGHGLKSILDDPDARAAIIAQFSWSPPP